MILLTIFALGPGFRRSDIASQCSDDVTEHLRGHVLAKRKHVLNALRPNFRGINSTVVVLDRLGEAKTEVPDPAHQVSLNTPARADRMRPYGGSAKGMFRKLVTDPFVVP